MVQISFSFWNRRRCDGGVFRANRTRALNPHHLFAREHVARAY